MPAQKRSQETPPPPPPPTLPPPASPPPALQQQPPEDRDDDSLQRNQNDNGEQADDADDSDGSASSSDGEKDEVMCLERCWLHSCLQTSTDLLLRNSENYLSALMLYHFCRFIIMKLSEIRKEVQCPICLGIIRKTRTVMECLHRFCRECIDKSMRLGNNECPACRTHCASRRSLRDDPKYDALIAALYPDIDKYEEEELAFHEEEKARNKQIQASIAQTFRRQTEALGRKRSARAAARRSHGSYRNVRGRRNLRTSEHQGSDEDDDANGIYGGKDSSSADERSPEVKPKRQKRWGGARFSQSSAAANSDAGYDENDSEVNRELLGASAGLIGGTEILAWGKGGMRSHTRHGGFSGGNGKFARNSRLSKLMDSLRCSDVKNEELDVSLELVAMDKEEIPNLQRPYLSCKPTLSVRHLCQYVALQTSMQAEEIEIWWKRELKKGFPPKHNNEAPSASAFLDQSENTERLDEHQTLGDIRTIYSSSQCNLVLAYGRK
ncbi:putative E3 ubiquitin-protein ligase RING1a isoform X2 [Coffea arabica]|uniref:E3 ubiquitin-protein ligase RING1a isoform X2 n=1 Tax=Coffea arabica TaxID=13443 RepID=A0ABM4WFD9_COFAR|nr:putative E3 ubiquitin-protein ligase RING1a isoform X2 [Coffea arabica]